MQIDALRNRRSDPPPLFTIYFLGAFYFFEKWNSLKTEKKFHWEWKGPRSGGPKGNEKARKVFEKCGKTKLLRIRVCMRVCACVVQRQQQRVGPMGWVKNIFKGKKRETKRARKTGSKPSAWKILIASREGSEPVVFVVTVHRQYATSSYLCASVD